MLHLGAFFFDFGEVLGAQSLVDRKFLLRVLFFSYVDIVGAQAVMGIRKVGINLESPDVVGNRLLIVVLVGIQISQLHMGLGKRIVERNGPLQQGLDRLDVDARILDALALP